jgi:hypothetical protein
MGVSGWCICIVGYVPGLFACIVEACNQWASTIPVYIHPDTGFKFGFDCQEGSKTCLVFNIHT